MVYASGMKARSACLLGVGFLWASGLGFLACSSSSGGFQDGGGPDAASDNTTTFDVPQTDGTGHNDMNAADSPSDGGSDTGPVDSGLKGHCSPVNGSCDMVLQNCPKNQECVIVSDPSAESGLGVTSECQPTQSSEHLPAGSFCCPGSGNNPCDPGTTCQGDMCLGDAGSAGGGGRCTPACCPAEAGANTQNCGASPEGYVGTCDLSLTGGTSTKSDPSGLLYNCCTYESTCTIFAKPCAAGYTCLVQDMSGTSKCVVIDDADGGTTGGASGSSCLYENECAPGLECVTFDLPDGAMPANGQCTYLCYLTGGSPPFDAGIITSAPGKGGCPAKSSCESASFLPSWLGVCAP
jgi:hypothetical protein